MLGDPEKDKEVFALRPMTCPFQYQAYLNKKRSYRDLPLRYDETSTLFRNEASGEMHGLIRVRQFTISEGHLMCRPDQLEDEFKSCLELTTFMLKTLGLYEDVSYRFSQWDPNNREKYIGTTEQWDEAQGVMKKILDHLEIIFKISRTISHRMTIFTQYIWFSGIFNQILSHFFPVSYTHLTLPTIA